MEIPGDINAISNHAADVSSEVHNLERTLNYSPNNCLDWLLYASIYRTWSRMWLHERRQLPVLWCKTDEPELTAAALGQRLLQDGDSVIHMTQNLPVLSVASLDGTENKLGLSALLFLIQQAYMIASVDFDFPAFIIESGIFDRRPDRIKILGAEAATIFARLLKSDPDRKWTLLIHNADSMHKTIASEVGKFLGRLLEPSSQLRVQQFRVVICGGRTSDIPQLARYCAVVDRTTEYLECLSSLQFDNMNVRRNRITSATVGTNHWIWDNPSYLAWKENQSSVVWICGKAGSGKSVLAKTMQEQLLADSQSLKSLVCSWFYSARDGLQLHGQMFKAMLYQLLSQASALFQSMKEVYRSGLCDGDEFSARRWQIGEVQSALRALFENSESRERLILFVLDGVDESNALNVGDDYSRPEALKFLVHLTKNSTLLKIIFLSRPSDDIGRVLRNQLFISIHIVNRPDIVFLIEEGVQMLSRRLDGYESDDEYSPVKGSFSRTSSFSSISKTASIPPEYFQRASSEKQAMLSEIDTYLRKNARGVVLWVTTVLDILQRKCKDAPFVDIASLRSQLDDLPLELTDLYSQITTKLIESFKGDAQTLRKARRALMWVSVSSKYTMQLQDLLEVISYDFSSEAAIKPTVFAGLIGWPSFKKEIEALCGPFIEVIPVLSRSDITQAPEATRWDSLQLPHESVRTFLQQSQDSLALGFSAAEAEKVVREERKAYMQRTLPYLDGLLSSKGEYQTILKRYCEYLDSRPLLCFILTTLELEFQYIMSLEGGKPFLASIINTCIIEKRRFVPSFIPVVQLLKAIGFLNPEWAREDIVFNQFYADDNKKIENLFFAVCESGMLNAANALSSLLAYPRGSLQKLAIIRGMMDAADEAEIDYHFTSFMSLVPNLDHDESDSENQLHCHFNKANSPSSKEVRVEAAISQIIDHGIFDGAAIGLWIALAQLQADSLLHAGIENYRLRSLNLKEKSNTTATYHRTPFTYLRISSHAATRTSSGLLKARPPGDSNLPQLPHLNRPSRRPPPSNDINLPRHGIQKGHLPRSMGGSYY
ncbi:hypothetical protein GGR55DRAFT_438734 [Xylaria sp. FL0064]|nr:hypothetical protein GGR55DRAFT_438734 [Xylaria sp. FL0064]